MTIDIIGSNGDLVRSWPVDNEFIVQAAKLEAELHNRDNPEDLWDVVITDQNETVEE